MRFRSIQTQELGPTKAGAQDCLSIRFRQVFKNAFRSNSQPFEVIKWRKKPVEDSLIPTAIFLFSREEASI